jgi:hypothetical protein
MQWPWAVVRAGVWDDGRRVAAYVGGPLCAGRDRRLDYASVYD